MRIRRDRATGRVDALVKFERPQEGRDVDEKPILREVLSNADPNQIGRFSNERQWDRGPEAYRLPEPNQMLVRLARLVSAVISKD